jgi:hypothetical protein
MQHGGASKENSRYIRLQVSDTTKAAVILEQKFRIKEYSIQDNQTILVYDTGHDMAEINRTLMLEDVSVISSQLCNNTLEDYFKKVTGGEGIA